MLAKYLATVEAFLRTQPAVWDPVGADNQCRIVVQRALEVRPGASEAWIPDAREVWLVGHRRPVPRSPARPANRPHAEHAVLCVADEFLVDFTRKQYDPDAPVPVIYDPIRAAGRDWRWLIDADSPDGERIALPIK
jgi:hypothetical protein